MAGRKTQYMIHPDDLSAILVMAAVLLIPTVPALLIYLILPTERVTISGKVHGITVKAAGGFAGYFILVVVATQVQREALKDAKVPFETWTISAIVKLDDPRDSISGVEITLEPSLLQFQQKSRTVAHVNFTAPIPKSGLPPQIIARMGAYLPAPYPIGLTLQEDAFTGVKYNVSRDPALRVMTIRDTLVLRRMESYQPTARPYSPVLLPVVSTATTQP